MQATKRPWKVTQEDVDPTWHIITADGGRITANICIENDMDRANAALICKAVNAYDGLRAENQSMKEALLEAIKVVEQDIVDCGPCDHGVNICVCGLIAVGDRIRAALAVTAH